MRRAGGRRQRRRRGVGQPAPRPCARARCAHLAVVQLAVLFLCMGLVLTNAGLAEAFGLKGPTLWLGFVFFMILFEPVQLLIGIAGNVWSRRHEFEADEYAASVTGGPEAMTGALKRLARDSLSNLTPHPLYVFLHYSHPPMLERLAALRGAG